MRVRTAVLVLTLVLLPGCMAASLRGLHSPDNHAFEPRMLGRWHGVTPRSPGSFLDETYWEPSGDWVVESGPRGSFRAIQRDQGDTLVYAGSAFRLADRLFLDLQPDSEVASRCNAFALFPCHAFASLEFVGDTMIVGYLRTDWLTEAAEEGELPEAVGLALTEDEEALLTGAPSELEKMMVKAAAAEGAFSIGKFVRER